jgi:hypothetical protein
MSSGKDFQTGLTDKYKISWKVDLREFVQNFMDWADRVTGEDGYYAEKTPVVGGLDPTSVSPSGEKKLLLHLKEQGVEQKSLLLVETIGSETLVITQADTRLERKALLFYSNKNEDSSAAGGFGEGLLIGALNLLVNGYTISYTMAHESWEFLFKPFSEDSSIKCMVVHITPSPIPNGVATPSPMVIRITGPDVAKLYNPGMYIWPTEQKTPVCTTGLSLEPVDSRSGSLVVPNNTHALCVLPSIDIPCQRGGVSFALSVSILCEMKDRGQIFCDGISIMTMKGIYFSYNIKGLPKQFMSRDRDGLRGDPTWLGTKLAMIPMMLFRMARKHKRRNDINAPPPTWFPVFVDAVVSSIVDTDDALESTENNLSLSIPREFQNLSFIDIGEAYMKLLAKGVAATRALVHPAAHQPVKAVGEPWFKERCKHEERSCKYSFMSLEPVLIHDGLVRFLLTGWDKEKALQKKLVGADVMPPKQYSSALKKAVQAIQDCYEFCQKKRVNPRQSFGKLKLDFCYFLEPHGKVIKDTTRSDTPSTRSFSAVSHPLGDVCASRDSVASTRLLLDFRLVSGPQKNLWIPLAQILLQKTVSHIVESHNTFYVQALLVCAQRCSSTSYAFPSSLLLDTSTDIKVPSPKTASKKRKTSTESRGSQPLGVKKSKPTESIVAKNPAAGSTNSDSRTRATSCVLPSMFPKKGSHPTSTTPGSVTQRDTHCPSDCDITLPPMKKTKAGYFIAAPSKDDLVGEADNLVGRDHTSALAMTHLVRALLDDVFSQHIGGTPVCLICVIPQAVLGFYNRVTNCVYINAGRLDVVPDAVFLTLCHEFAHALDDRKRGQNNSHDSYFSDLNAAVVHKFSSIFKDSAGA